MKTLPPANAAKHSAPAVPSPVPLACGKIKFNTAESYEFIHPDEIDFIEGADSQSSLFLTGKETPLVISLNLKKLFDDKVLPSDVFLRVHHSYIVNTNKIRRYIKENGGSIILINGKKIPVSDKYRDEVMARIKAMN